jgi:tetraacyldisaccharide 4'-kinase
MNLLAKLLLAPFALVYYFVTSLRNHLFNIGYTRSFKFDTVVIGVGNLAVGGSGKTPMVEYIIELLHSHGIKIATLSRGYKRRTKGFRLATGQDDAFTLGDEPYQIYLKYGNMATIAVGEERALAIPNILFERPETQAIIMDDAFQHRYVQPDLNILLTDYSKPFYEDMIMPLGRLREKKSGAKRADVIVVTKCPEEMMKDSMDEIEEQIKPFASQNALVCFSQIKYASPIPVFQDAKAEFFENIILLTGIADNDPLKQHVTRKYRLLETIAYPDHHFYTDKDVNDIIKKFDQVEADKKTLLTTEKDMVKLVNLQQKDRFDRISLYYLPIKVHFLKNGKAFENNILDLFGHFSKKKT